MHTNTESTNFATAMVSTAASQPPLESSISDRQRSANRANAQLSTGPRTEEGKATSRYNARRHGLTRQFYTMSEDDETAYLDFQSSMFLSLKPEGPYETQLAVSIAQDHWRLNRSRATESNTYSDSVPDGTTGDNRAIANIALYESRIHRMITKNNTELKALQAERKALEAAARHEAELLIRLELMENATHKPAAPIEINGFVFSTAEILANIRHQERLAEARHYAKHGWDRTRRYQSPFTRPIAA